MPDFEQRMSSWQNRDIPLKIIMPVVCFRHYLYPLSILLKFCFYFSVTPQIRLLFGILALMAD
jgi:hypothetical protein